MEKFKYYDLGRTKMINETTERADTLMDETKDPYAALRGEWVTISSGQRSESGLYLGLNRNKLHVSRTMH